MRRYFQRRWRELRERTHITTNKRQRDARAKNKVGLVKQIYVFKMYSFLDVLLGHSRRFIRLADGGSCELIDNLYKSRSTHSPHTCQASCIMFIRHALFLIHLPISRFKLHSYYFSVHTRRVPFFNIHHRHSRTKILDWCPAEPAHRKFREDLVALSGEGGTTGYFE